MLAHLLSNRTTCVESRTQCSELLLAAQYNLQIGGCIDRGIPAKTYARLVWQVEVRQVEVVRVKPVCRLNRQPALQELTRARANVLALSEVQIALTEDPLVSLHSIHLCSK